MSNLESVFAKYPKDRENNALCGWIPIEDFNAIESSIRPEIRERKLRVWYRGPRPIGCCVTATVRKNATHAVIYKL